MWLRTRAGVIASIAVIAVGVACLPATARADVVKNISTGINPGTGARLPNGAANGTYVIAPGGTGGRDGAPVNVWSEELASTYVPDAESTQSRWIAIYTGEGNLGLGVYEGTYFYQTTVDLTGYDPATAIIASPRLAVDDAFHGVKVNGVDVFTPPPPGYYSNMDHFVNLPANLGAGAFRPGVNTITFVVENVVLGSPASLRLEASVTATPVPEPLAVGIIAIAGMFALGRAINRRRTSPRDGRDSSSVEPIGIEPTTPALQRQCSPN